MEKSNVVTSLPNKSSAGDNNDSDRIPFISDEIFCKLNKEDVVQARLVCPSWRTIIDNCYKFSITIRERPFEELPVPFKVITCSIYQLKKHVDKIFKYPYNLQNLKLLDKVKLSTLRNIFKKSSNLKNLDFANSQDHDKAAICMPEEPLNFYSLLQLKVLHSTMDYCRGKGNARIINTQRIFFYEMPLIQRLDFKIVELWYRCDKIILPSFLEFLAKHSKTIKQLRASLTPKSIIDAEGEKPLSEELFNKILPQNIMKRLHDPAFQVTTLILTPAERYFRLWDRIISNQKNLITFYTESNEDLFVDRFALIPYGTLKPTLVRNASTLVNLHLTHLSLEQNPDPNVDPPQFLPIDGLAFQDFHKLRRLTLRRSVADYVDYRDTQLNETAFINISSIPLEFLEVLEIEWLVCETSELERLVENTPRLKIVIFHFTGDVDGKGVTTGIIDNLAKKSDIQIIKVFPLNLPSDKKEAEKKLVELEKQYPQPQAVQYRHVRRQHSYFDFDKFRKGTVHEKRYMQYSHPFYFE